MNRIIKFRFWANHKVSSNEIISGNRMIYPETKENYSGFFTNKNYIPLQFTGLKDQNGADIYEGDIVSFKNKLYQIQYNKGSFWLDGLNTIGIIWLEGGVEIKGNIFQNPELLK